MGKIKKSPTKLPVPKYNLRTRNPPQPNQTSKNQNSKSPIHKCNLCGLHFLHAARLNAHIPKCWISLSLKCRWLSRIFQALELQFRIVGNFQFFNLYDPADVGINQFSCM